MMKCNLKDRFIQVSFKEFCSGCPDLAELIRKDMPDLYHDLLTDDNYVVRISEDGQVEFGYSTDDWYIGC